MNPGATTNPVASMVSLPVMASSVMAVILPALTPTFATASKPGSGSMTRQFRMTRSRSRVSCCEQAAAVRVEATAAAAEAGPRSSRRAIFSLCIA